MLSRGLLALLFALLTSCVHSATTDPDEDDSIPLYYTEYNYIDMDEEPYIYKDTLEIEDVLADKYGQCPIPKICFTNDTGYACQSVCLSRVSSAS